MRLVEGRRFGIRFRELDEIVLTERERAVLRQAADILSSVRETRNARVPCDWYAGDEDDSDLVFGWRICSDLAKNGRIDAAEVAR